MSYISHIRQLYHHFIRAKKEEPRFLILSSFIVTFFIARLVVYSANGILPLPFFHNVYVRQIHIHHLVYGIFLLLIAGFIGILHSNKVLDRLSSVLYGIGAALTLDEFALWLHLDPTRYFGRQGRISLDAVCLFVLLLLMSFFHGSFWKRVILFTLSFFGVKKHTKKRHV